MSMSHKYIWLQPECCAYPDLEKMWCPASSMKDPGPVDCEHGKKWTRYIRFDNHEHLRNEHKILNLKIKRAIWELIYSQPEI